jgi:3-dehydroquinate synthase
MEPNLILTGFMGTGKTTVGQLIAQRLGRPFVDTDAWIEARAGKSVAAIFAEDGEDRFRAWEAEACTALSEPNGLIIATGGWTLGPATNRELIEQGGCVICLTAEPEALLSRLNTHHDRPLLTGDDRAARIRALLKEREPVYQSLAWQIDTTHIDVPEVVMHVMAVWGALGSLPKPETFHLPMGERSMSIVLGTDLLDALGPLLRARGLSGTVALIGDSNVAPLYGDRVAQSLALSGFESRLLRVPAGEESKTLDTAAMLYDNLVEGGLERGGLIMAVGGGVIGDLAGFVAATYMRGVRWVCVPTSLLAMIDASIGGKVGVDLPAGKNLVGAFHPPLLTMVDMTMMHTLPGREFRSGLAEMIKAGLIGDAELFAMFETGQTDLPEMIRRAITVKVGVVRDDPFEKGRRAALNLGHTIGHGIEAASNYALRHGEAIAIGLIAEAKVAERVGLARGGLSDRIERVIERVELPARCADLDPTTIMAWMRSDKKKQRGRLKFALPRDVGEVIVGVSVDDDVVRAVLDDMKELR